MVAEDLLTMALESLPDGFVLYDADDRLVICNKNYRKIYASSAAAMKSGATFQDILQYGLDRGEYADGIGREAEWLQERLAAHHAADVCVEQQLASGQWLRIVERLTPNGGRVGLRIDITELKNNEAKLARYARTDHLTGLMNRRGLYEEINALAAKLTHEEHIAILHIDLDKFKSVNDAQGNDAGDYVLQQCAKMLCDLVKDRSGVARVGGDEFIVFFKSNKSIEDVFALCRKVIACISVPLVFRDRICNVGASVGFALYRPDGTDDVGAALTGADIALHNAKQAGRGQCRMFEEHMRDGAIQQIQLGHEIRDGIAADQFEPFFQPQVDTHSGEIFGFEALIRWRHPVRGLVSPFEFLPAAERAGLMGELDEVILDKSCAAAAILNKWGLSHASISVNMSMSLLQDTEILARLKRHTDQHGIRPCNLRLELLESTLLDERSDIIVKNAHKLIRHGYAVELDDFGTGHAAIATLCKFSVSRIKIDRSLVQDIDTDAELRVITSAIINLAEQLGIKALAEGVETSGEQDTLNEMGCFLAQGYFHARPMPLADLRAWITGHFAAKSGAMYRQTPESGLIQ